MNFTTLCYIEKENQYKAKITWKEIKRQKVLLFWSGVMVIYGIIFYYLPLAGWAKKNGPSRQGPAYPGTGHAISQ